MRQIALDTETTGLSPEKGHRVIEIGCIEMINRRITDNHYHCYINPRRDIDPGAEQVHGISADFLQDKPLFNDIAPQFIEYLTGADEIIIHNAPFDVGFLNAELRRFQKKRSMLSICSKIIDTLEMARSKHPGQHNNLDALCKRYGVNNAHRDLHGALVDADLLARVYLFMTGGQDSFFDMGEETTLSKDKSKNNKPVRQASQNKAAPAIDKKKLFVLKANETENKAHAAYMAELEEKS